MLCVRPWSWHIMAASHKLAKNKLSDLTHWQWQSFSSLPFSKKPVEKKVQRLSNSLPARPRTALRVRFPVYEKKQHCRLVNESPTVFLHMTGSEFPVCGSVIRLHRRASHGCTARKSHGGAVLRRLAFILTFVISIVGCGASWLKT